MDFKDWYDPNPEPVIIQHDGIYVVRDDLLDGGSKVRFADFMVRNIDKHELVYGGCPATGYAQISLPSLTNKYDKKTVLFMAKRSMDNLTTYQKRGISLGATYNWVPDGMLTVTKCRARQYVEEDPDNRELIEFGLYHHTVIDSIVKVCKENIHIEPTEIWSVGSSGTLTRGLQKAYPNLDIHVVQVGHKMKPEEYGRAKLHVSPYKFYEGVKIEDKPPFPSVPNYDAKGWQFVKKYAKKGAMFWNVCV
jgi:hypothetical protein